MKRWIGVCACLHVCLFLSRACLHSVCQLCVFFMRLHISMHKLFLWSVTHLLLTSLPTYLLGSLTHWLTCLHAESPDYFELSCSLSSLFIHLSTQFLAHLLTYVLTHSLLACSFVVNFLARLLTYLFCH